MNGKKARLFVDMDGTLAEWQEGTPLEEVCAPGYFAQLPPNENMAKAMIRFWEYSRKNIECGKLPFLFFRQVREIFEY